MMIFCIAFPLFAAFIVFALGRVSARVRNLAAVLACAIELAAAVLLCLRPYEACAVDAVCSLGLSFETDGFRCVYAVLVSLAWLGTTLFGSEYFSHYERTDAYYLFNLITLGAVMGVFLSADLATTLIFFEVMSFTSYTWVILEQTDGAIRSANTYLAVAVIGGLAALMGLFILTHELGTVKIGELASAAAACPRKGALYAAGSCILFGFGAKAGMFPLHIWLPKAHPVAPAPASALLSGVLTKTGIFGVLVLATRLFSRDRAWGILMMALAAVTMVLGALLALFSVDLKRTLACSSVSQIGFILVGVACLTLAGPEGTLAARGTLLHMVNHTLLKLVLFLAAGAVYMNLHVLDLNEVRGFGRKKPALLFAFLMGGLGIGGFPLWNGYVSKTLLHEGILELAEEASGADFAGLKAVEVLFLVSGGLTVAYMTKLFICLFVEKHPTRQAEYDAKRGYMKPASAAALVGAACLLPLLGMTCSVSMDAIADLGTDFFGAEPLRHAVAYFSWENLKGAAISIVIGAAVYFGVVRPWLMKNGRYVDRWPKWLDLEDSVYRPLLLRLLPSVLGFAAKLFGENRLTASLAGGALRASEILAHALSDLPDAAVVLVRKTLLPELRRGPKGAAASLPYRFGAGVDRLFSANGREKAGGHIYADLFYRVARTVRNTSRRIMGNLSFALLMLCAAIVFVLVYMFLIHG